MKRNMLTLSALAAMGVGSAMAGATIPELDTVRIVSGLARPLWVCQAPGDDTRLFICEQFSGTQGRIRVFNLTTNTLLPAPFLSVTVATGNEQGLLGMAFHPDYQTNGKFYIHFNPPGGATNVTEYTVSADPNLANAGSANLIFSVAQPFSNHNGGWMAFGPDGLLYLALGDGGSGNDPGNRAQNLTASLLGKMLRFDVNGDDFPADPNRDYAIPPTNPYAGAIPGLDEIWLYGLRNHFRNSFDRENGDLYIGDVGQNNWEEVSYWKAGTPSGVNYGWRCMEGNNCTGLTGCTCEIGCGSGVLRCPIQQYSHSADGFSCSITGGYVYRGNAICELRGTYFYADYCSNRIKSFTYNRDTGVLSNFTDRTAELAPGGGLSIVSITSFGEDNAGELYIVDQGGEVFKIVTAVPGSECPDPILLGDMNCDGVVSVGDIAGFVLALTDPAGYATTYPKCDINAADVNQDSVISVGDIAGFVTLLTGL
ncbi:MAG: PQQ-dependent sugar dehydrogenase [Phycisphaerae bacterium]|nr:PQQ-dependent sugar dehydrogenase [Phycisphaerae bacterium]